MFEGEWEVSDLWDWLWTDGDNDGYYDYAIQDWLPELGGAAGETIENVVSGVTDPLADIGGSVIWPVVIGAGLLFLGPSLIGAK